MLVDVGDPFGMNDAKVSVLEEINKVSLHSLLESYKGRAIEAKVHLEVLSKLLMRHLNNGLWMRSLMHFWYFWISLYATIPG